MTLLAVVELGRGLVPADAPVLYPDDEGVLRARAVFETLRVYEGRPFRLVGHLDRFAASAARLGLPPPEREAFTAAVAEALAAAGVPDAVLRLLWTAGREGMHRPVGLALVSSLPPDLDELHARGLRLATVPWAPGALAGAKSTSYAANLAARDAAARRDADDALLVAADGTVLEAPTANVWWREHDRLLTPTLELPILAGVTRAALLELAPAVGYTLEEGSYPLERLLEAEEVFLSSSIREVMPVVAVDGRPVGSGVPGPAAAALQRALRKAAGTL
ncbi:MAG TPA: aminotransferase class IV [Gaiellaceae bacterium]|nr:aminotransferase class IV [Gaiellaceae bacterium]